MAGTHSVTRLFLNVRDTLGYTLVFKGSCQTRFHTCFQMVGKHAITHWLSNGLDTFGWTVIFKCPWHTRLHNRFQTRFSSCWYTPGYTHNFKWSRNMRLNIRFQSVRRHGYTLVFKKFGHPVTHSFLNGLVTPGYTLVFKWSAHNRLTTTRFQMVVPHPVFHLFFKLLIHTRLYTQFQMVGKHAVFKWSGHTRLHTRFQIVKPHPVSHSFYNGRDTPD